MTRFLLLVLTLLILSGCGGFAYNYSKPGVSQQQRSQDHFECKQISRQPFIVGTGGMLVGGSEPTWETFKECLEARGYTITVDGGEQRQAERQQLMTEQRVLIEQQRVLEEQKRVLDEQRAALSGGGGQQQYEQTVGAYNQEVADFNQRLADLGKRALDYSKRVDDFNR